MIQALKDYVVLGVRTSIDFLTDVIGHSAFRAGQTTTSFIAEHFSDWAAPEAEDGNLGLIAAAAAFEEINRKKGGIDVSAGKEAIPTPWQSLGHWRMGGE